ncbi:50S ribosomal protein L18 [Sphingobacteriales bacterium UPWRP_1]|nr:50S ribosomal protein L18 [Sphingobacteriales bacterium UPWRP_1]
MAFDKALRRQKIRYRIRKKVSGTSAVPRLAVFRSNKFTYCQLIDDENGVTLTSASSKEPGIATQKVTKVAASKLTGKLAAERAIAAGVTTVVFDRGGYLYHGRVKAVAEGAREGGLKF